jgi:hypothetical protein
MLGSKWSQGQLVSEFPLESASLEVEWPTVRPLSHCREGLTSKHIHVYKKTKILIMDSDGTWKQELLYCQRPAAILLTNQSYRAATQLPSSKDVNMESDKPLLLAAVA